MNKLAAQVLVEQEFKQHLFPVLYINTEQTLP